MVSILGANSVSGGYEVSNSLRFNDDDSAYLSRTPSSAGNRKTFTWSGWVKRSSVGSSGYLFTAKQDANNRFDFGWYTSGILFNFVQSGSTQLYVRPLALFRDPSAWYHLLFSIDTTNATASDRFKIYVNGVRVTDFVGGSEFENNFSQNDDTVVNTTNPHAIGANPDAGTPFDGYMADVHFIDGTVKAHTDFGEFDDNGVWIPIKYTGTYGTNGFYFEFKQTGTSQNSSGIGADTSGNDNHFAVSNLAATDVTEDTCTNNFATFNPLYVDRFSNIRTLSEGNCEVDYPNSGNDGTTALTQAVDNGKWYIEMKVIDSAGFYPAVGSINENASQTVPYGRLSTGLAIAYDTNGTLKYENSNTSYGNSVSNGDIFQIALDMDNHLVWFGINGTWQNSATQTEIENSTATNDATTKVGEQTFLTDYDDITIFVGDVNSNGTANVQLNTGNPPFSISSGNNDDNGYGNFEYAPPSGYYALCTKNLAEFG